MSNYLITGISSEIGTALSRYLYSKGHNVIGVSFHQKKESECIPVLNGIDLTHEDCLKKLPQFAKAHFESSPFTLIHSVGSFWEHKSINDTDFSEVVNMIMSHYVTLFGTVKYLLPMMESSGGKIIAFSCNSVKYNYPDMAAFTSSKAAIECFIRCLANEKSQYGIIANAFALPSIKTENVIKTKPKEYIANYITLSELTSAIESACESISPLTNGNIISLFKYSNSFYHKGYYERNKIWEAHK